MNLNWSKSSASMDVMSVCFIGSDSLFFRVVFKENLLHSLILNVGVKSLLPLFLY